MRAIFVACLAGFVILSGCLSSPPVKTSVAPIEEEVEAETCVIRETWWLTADSFGYKSPNADASWDMPPSTGPFILENGLHIPFNPIVRAGYVNVTGVFHFEATAQAFANPAYVGRMVIREPDHVVLGGPASYAEGDTFTKEFAQTFANTTSLESMNLVSFYIDPYPTGGVLLTSTPEKPSHLTFAWPC